jgi:hypothetical protein
VIALFAEALAPAPVPSAEPSKLELVIGAVVTGATAVPAWLGFAEPVRRGAVVTAWLRTIGSVFLTGALIALANWIYTLCSLRWTQAGLPVITPINVKPGGGALPIGTASTVGSSTQTTTSGKASWLGEMYKD